RRVEGLFLGGGGVETAGADKLPDHAVALAIDIELAVGVNREAHVGAAAKNEILRTGQTLALAAALVVHRLGEGKHRVVRLALPAHFLFAQRRERRGL